MKHKRRGVPEAGQISDILAQGRASHKGYPAADTSSKEHLQDGEDNETNPKEDHLSPGLSDSEVVAYCRSEISRGIGG